jgi:hypothetical protein
VEFADAGEVYLGVVEVSTVSFKLLEGTASENWELVVGVSEYLGES